MYYEIGQIFIDDDDYTNKANWCNKNGCYIEEIEPKEDGTRQFKICAIPEPTGEEVKVAIINAVQAKLDKVCKAKGYDNGFACASYASSTVETFKNEADAFITWRDACWVKCYSLLEQYQSGLIERPTVEQVLTELPNLEW